MLFAFDYNLASYLVCYVLVEEDLQKSPWQDPVDSADLPNIVIPLSSNDGSNALPSHISFQRPPFSNRVNVD